MEKEPELETEVNRWQDADEVAKALAINLNNMGSIKEYVEDINLRPFIDAKGAERDLGLLSKDISVFANRLKEINQSHKGKKGKINNANDNMQFINTMVAYGDLSEDIDLVIIPSFTSLCDNISRAKHHYEQSRGQA